MWQRARQTIVRGLCWAFIASSLTACSLGYLPLACCDYDYTMKLGKEVAGKAFLTSYFRVERRNSIVLDDSYAVYAAFSESEAWVDADVPLASQLCRSVNRNFVRTQCGLDIETLDQALTSAVQQHADYLFYPRVQHWQDRVDSGREVREQLHSNAHERSWGLDSMSVEVLVLDARTGRHVDTLYVTGRSGIAQWGRHTPADMMGDALAEVFAVLIQRPVK